MHLLMLSVNWTGWTYDTLTREQQALATHLEALGHRVTFHGPGFAYDTNHVPTILQKLRDRGQPVDLLFCFQTEFGLLEPMSEAVCGRWQVPSDRARFPVGLDQVKDIPKVLWNNDFWHLTQAQWDQAILGNGFGDILATYTPPYLSRELFNQTYSDSVRRQVRFHALPRGVDTRLFYDRQLERDIDVCLLGAMGDFYPLRGLVHESLSHQSWLRYFHQPHPGYRYTASLSQGAPPQQTLGLCGEAYAQVLARSKVFVSCTGKYNLPFIKISEVLASGAVLMCDRPCGADELGLVDDVNYVPIDAVNFMGRLQDLLHDPPRLNRIAHAGRQLAKTKLALPHYARRAAEILLSIPTFTQTPVVLESPDAVVATNMVGKARRIVRRKLEAVARRLLPDPPVIQSPALRIASGTRLDWAQVVEHCHILDCSRSPGNAEMQLIQHLGLNAYWGRQPVVTQNPEVVSFRPLLLQELARALGARHLTEIGTARGMQCMFWARYLRENPGLPGRVYTCDIVGHDEPVFRTPLTGERHWTRRELWQGLPESGLIDFVHGNSGKLAAHLAAELNDAKLDLVYIDGEHLEAFVMADYLALLPFLSPCSVLVFDDCDGRFPGVEKAVQQIAKERQAPVRIIEFWPNPYLIAVVGVTPDIKTWQRSLAGQWCCAA